jgi:hypothetical protein
MNHFCDKNIFDQLTDREKKLIVDELKNNNNVYARVGVVDRYGKWTLDDVYFQTDQEYDSYRSSGGSWDYAIRKELLALFQS